MTLLIVIADELAFFTVTVFDVDVFSATFPNPRLVGLNVNGDAGPFWPVPCKKPTAGVPAAL